MDVVDKVYAYVDANQPMYVDQLCTLVAHPSISTRAEGVAECARLLEEMLQQMGFSVTLLPTAGHTAILAEMRAARPGPTVLIYGHYDVQPPEPLAAWESPPFTPTIRGGRLYGRGAGDNKGQFLAQLAAITSVRAVTGSLPVNVKVLLEGDEEIGSPHLANLVRNNRERLQADLVYTSDGPIHISGRPQVVFGVRGLLCLDVALRGANRDLHSGNFGGPVPNAAWDLVRLLAGLKNASGRVLVDGFYDGVEPPVPAERAVLEQIPFDAGEVARDLGLATIDSDRSDFYERLMLQPTLNICGLSSGYAGEGIKTIIPSRASAKIDVRLVMNQDPDRVFESLRRHLLAVRPDLEIKKTAGVMPSRTPVDHPYAQCIIDAVTRGWGEPPVILPSLGGTLPDYVFTRIAGLPSFLVPYANHDENNHSPNENMSLECFRKGIRSCAAFLCNLGGISQ